MSIGKDRVRFGERNDSLAYSHHQHYQTLLPEGGRGERGGEREGKEANTHLFGCVVVQEFGTRLSVCF